MLEEDGRGGGGGGSAMTDSGGNGIRSRVKFCVCVENEGGEISHLSLRGMGVTLVDPSPVKRFRAFGGSFRRVFSFSFF